ncbi:acetoacetate decarboxylase family protein [Desulfatirhabdium butyrativorans]|uniref:acetoacetate decarboxylase family protein n=1 Tax=Desulfatirhabdium butyrativorans TaxID=340467 RepID=UPI000403898D|nr:acetoacetate decarboxylase family protein [Desulfatirhabdium butyrativorans]
MFKFEDDKCYRMPAHFGGSPFDPEAKANYNDVTSLTYRYRTDGDKLADYIPEGFELTSPELIIQYQQCRQVEWMAGSYYNLVSVGAPVRFNGREDRLEGTYSLVIWENKTTPILTGNMMGVPKIYADIEDLHILADTYRACLSYEGNTFLQMEMKPTKALKKQQVNVLTTDFNSFGWRYIPKVGGPGADLSQPILFPMRNEPDCGWQGNGAIQWTELSWEQNPMQWHIIKALAQLPIVELAPVILTKGRMVLMEARGKVLR